MDNLPQGVTPEMIQAWKEKHKHIRLIRLQKGFAAIAHRPARNIVNQWEKFSDSDPNKARTILIENCVLFGKEEVLADDELFYSCAAAITEMIPISKAETENL